MAVEIKKSDIDELCDRRHDNNDEKCCVCKIVKFIDTLQRKCANNSSCINCNAKRLGENVPGVNTFNTRPFILYTENGDPFAIVPDPINDPETETTIFRVESVNDCCAVLRALIVDGDTIIGTNTCCNVDLCKFICIQCLQDVFIGCTPIENSISI